MLWFCRFCTQGPHKTFVLRMRMHMLSFCTGHAFMLGRKQRILSCGNKTTSPCVCKACKPKKNLYLFHISHPFNRVWHRSITPPCLFFLLLKAQPIFSSCSQLLSGYLIGHHNWFLSCYVEIQEKLNTFMAETAIFTTIVLARLWI